MSSLPGRIASSNSPDKQSRRTTLADGTSIASLIDRQRREVSARVFSDPEVFQLELERIFSKTWNLIAHVSEIPKPGDFVTRMLGNDGVIVARRRDGEIDCLLNMCAHRGARVCREESGNAAAFRCIYHGWTYNLDGSFRGMPWKEHMFPRGVETERLGLSRARVQVRNGFVFANWDGSAPPLADYLGDFGKYFDLVFDLLPDGMEVVGPPQRYVVDGNWKMASEQLAGDTYHAHQLHRDMLKAFPSGPQANNPDDWQMSSPWVNTDGGHSIACFDQLAVIRTRLGLPKGAPMPAAAERLSMLPPPGVPHEMLPQLHQHMRREDMEFIATTPPSNGIIFPYSAIWNMWNPLAGGPPAPAVGMRIYRPIAADKFEFCMWVVVAKGASEEYRNLVRRGASFALGAGGFVEGDDGAVWPGQIDAARGHIASRVATYKYGSYTDPKPNPEGWIGGGRVNTEFARDDGQWNWWSRYFDYLEGKA